MAKENVQMPWMDMPRLNKDTKLMSLKFTGRREQKCVWAKRSGIWNREKFHSFHDKERSTETLLDLTKDNDSDVRRYAAEAISSAFDNLTDKDQATNDLFCPL